GAKIVALGEANETKTVHVWDATTGEEKRRLLGHRAGIQRVVFSWDGTRLASSSFDNTIRLWDLATGEETAQIVTPRVVDKFLWLPDGKTLLTAGNNASLHLWDTATGQRLAILDRVLGKARPLPLAPEVETPNTVFDMSVSEDGKTLVMAVNGEP